METTRKCKTTVHTDGDERVREQHCVTRTKKLEASESDSDAKPRGRTSKEAKDAAARYALKRASARAAPAVPPAPTPNSAREAERESLVGSLRRLSKVSKDLADKQGPEAREELKREILRAFREDVVRVARRVKDRAWRAKITMMREALEKAQSQMVGLPPEERVRATVQRFKELLASLVVTMREGIALAYGAGGLWG